MLGIPGDLAADAWATVVGPQRAILGICGAPGAGKSTLATWLVQQVADRWGSEQVAYLPMDGFHLADQQLARAGSLRRKGAPDTFDALGYAHLLERIRGCPHELIYVPEFDRTLEQPVAGALAVPPTARLVITEGNYLLLAQQPWPRARAALDAVWYLQVPDDVRTARLVNRHVQFGKSRAAAQEWVRDSDEVNARLVAAAAERADRVLRPG